MDRTLRMTLINRYLLVDFLYISGFDFCSFLLYPQNILYTKTPIFILWEVISYMVAFLQVWGWVLATSTYILATSTRILATLTRFLATSTRILATSVRFLATSTRILATLARILATSTRLDRKSVV